MRFSGSLAVADSATVEGAVTCEPLAGLVNVTAGDWLPEAPVTTTLSNVLRVRTVALWLVTASPQSWESRPAAREILV